MKNIIVLLTLCCWVLSINARSEESTHTDSCVSRLSQFVRNINTFNFLNPQEKVYLHFDNTSYFVGDTIWFKAFVVSASDLKPTIYSRVLYVELITPEGDVIDIKKLKIEDGGCHGAFALEKRFRSGYYEVRSYTRVMLNYGAETLFSRVFPVYKEPEFDGEYADRSMKEPYQNLEYKREKSIEKSDKVNLTFYPEGGNLVQGLISQIAFKATNSIGQGIDLSGIVINNKGDEITTFSTTHQGMGFFQFCPDSSKYKVKVTYKDKDYTFKLPEASPTGYVLTINNLQKDNTIIQLKRSTLCPGDTVGISISSRGKINFFDIVEMVKQPEYLLKTTKKNLPAGVNQITIFTQTGEIIAQRMIFIHPEVKKFILVAPSKNSYKPFEKISLDCRVTDPIGNPIETSFSLSIRDSATEFAGQHAANMRTNLLLSSDLKGYIEDANYYLVSNDKMHRHALDLLLMIQGWSRYPWPLMAGEVAFDCRHKIEKGIVIDGTVFSLSPFGKKIKPNLEVKMWLYSDSGKAQRGVCITDNKGMFNFLPEDFFGKWNLMIETSKIQVEKDVQQKIWTRIQLDRIFSPKPRMYSSMEVEEPDSVSSEKTTAQNTAEYQKTSITENQLLKEVRVSASKKRSVKKDVVYNVEKEIDDMIDQGFSYPNTVQEYMMARDSKFWFKGVNGSTTSGNSRYGSGGWATISFDANGKQITGWRHQDETIFRPIEEVQKIVVSFNDYKKLPNNDSEIKEGVVVYVYPFKFTSARIQKGMRATYLEGYALPPKEFYHPDYSKGVLPGDVDYRRTLYWNPDVKTDSTGKAVIALYNNGSCKKLIISAEGMTSDGIPIAN